VPLEETAEGVVVPTSQHKNLPPLVEGPAIQLASRHAKFRRDGTGDDSHAAGPSDYAKRPVNARRQVGGALLVGPQVFDIAQGLGDARWACRSSS